MRIGVVCEGPTDFFAIKEFLGHSLETEGVETQFVPLQPEIDKTASDGGWTQVLTWLLRNPPATRIQKYFGGGLFGGTLGVEPMNGLLIQLDSDILGDDGFKKFVRDVLDLDVENPAASAARAEQVKTVLSRASKLAEMTDADVERHVLAPAVESTENWCVAAFLTPTRDFETLAGAELVDEFMCALERSEGKDPSPPYSKISKGKRRRRRFCSTHRNCSQRVITGCFQFSAAHDQLLALS
ncbi:MAG: hypothetical protein GVY36_19650 [Verrucomicrobia bacterium]|jgi:hypothetical protein|nr:hypothetical protein [Verrucomicrobiota bacterium]